MRRSERYQALPFLKIRRSYVDVLRAGRRKNMIHGLIELDVTDARRVLVDQKTESGALSFTAFVMHCVAAAVEHNRLMHPYRRRNRLVLFDEVDVNTQIEADLDGQKVVKSLIVRAANRKSVAEITAEIRSAQHDTSHHGAPLQR